MRTVENWHPVYLTVCIVMMGLILAIMTLIFPYIDRFSTLGAVCTSLITAGLIICFILFVSIYLDRRISDSSYYLMCLIAVLYLSLCVEYLYWLASDIYMNAAMLNAVYHLEHIILPPLLYVFVNYEFTILDPPEDLIRKRKRIALVLMTAEAAMLLLNYATGYAFYLVGMGYVNTVFIWTLIIPTVLMTLMCACLPLCHPGNLRHRVVLLICILIPLVTGVLAMPLHIPSFTTLSILLVALVIYGEIYMDRGIRILKNEAALTEHRVAAMVSRIEPNLLDEALTGIMNMEGNPPETIQAINEFKSYLEENISTISETDPIPFTTELQHVKTYVKLEKLRFKDKVNVVFVTPHTDFMIPPMTLQMIVENAIKHGITQKEDGGTVTVSTSELEGFHRITVSDDGVGFDTEAPMDPSRNHIGMANVTARLRDMMDGTFEVKSKIGAGTTAIVLIPKK